MYTNLPQLPNSVSRTHESMNVMFLEIHEYGTPNVLKTESFSVSNKCPYRTECDGVETKIRTNLVGSTQISKKVHVQSCFFRKISMEFFVVFCVIGVGERNQQKLSKIYLSVDIIMIRF